MNTLNPDQSPAPDPLRGKPKRSSIHVNGPWCITYAGVDGDACDVDLENYH